MKAPRISRPSSGADGDVLQVRVAAAQPSGRGDGLVEARVHAAGVRVDEQGQRVDVGALQLHQPAPVENHPRQVVRERQLLEDFDGGRRRLRRAGSFEHGQAQPVEQHLRELLRRVDVELAAGQLEDLLHQAVQLEVDLPRLDRQRRRIDAHAGPLDRRSARESGAARGSGRRRPAAPSSSRPRRIGASWPARSARSQAKSSAASTGMSPSDSALTPLPQTSSSVSALYDRVLERQLLERIGRPRGVHQVAGDHRVEVEPGQAHTVPGEHDRVELEVVADLRHARVFEQRLQQLEHASRAASDAVSPSARWPVGT